MIPLAELPSTDGVYVIHFSAPLAHARGYVGWSIDVARRVAAHLDVEACRQAGSHLNADACRRAGGCQHRTHHPGSPLVCAAIRSGRSVWVAQIYPGGDRGLERRLHDRHTHACASSAALSAAAAASVSPPVHPSLPASPHRGAGAAPRWRLRHDRS